jgi:hypothetical protein
VITLFDWDDVIDSWDIKEFGHVWNKINKIIEKDEKKVNREGVFRFWLGDNATKYAKRTRSPLA